MSSRAGYTESVALGGKSIGDNTQCVALARGAIQLGAGTNSAADTLAFRRFQLLDADGNIPPERMLLVPSQEETQTWDSVVGLQAGDLDAQGKALTNVGYVGIAPGGLQVGEPAVVIDSGVGDSLHANNQIVAGRFSGAIDGVNLDAGTVNSQAMDAATWEAATNQGSGVADGTVTFLDNATAAWTYLGTSSLGVVTAMVTVVGAEDTGTVARLVAFQITMTNHIAAITNDIASLSNAVSPGAAAGLQATAWGDHRTNGYLTAETDPNWAAVSNGMATNIAARVPTARQLTINGTTYDLSEDRDFGSGGGATSGIMRIDNDWISVSNRASRSVSNDVEISINGQAINWQQKEQWISITASNAATQSADINNNVKVPFSWEFFPGRADCESNNSVWVSAGVPYAPSEYQADYPSMIFNRWHLGNVDVYSVVGSYLDNRQVFDVGGVWDSLNCIRFHGGGFSNSYANPAVVFNATDFGDESRTNLWRWKKSMGASGTTMMDLWNTGDLWLRLGSFHGNASGLTNLGLGGLDASAQSEIAKGTNAYGWGNHASAGYATAAALNATSNALLAIDAAQDAASSNGLVNLINGKMSVLTNFYFNDATGKLYFGPTTNAPWMMGMGTTNIGFGAPTSSAVLAVFPW